MRTTTGADVETGACIGEGNAMADWSNEIRVLEPIGNIPPAEAEARYYAQTEAQALAA